jgi:hypothetical protein
MSTILIEFFEIKNLFIKLIHNDCSNFYNYSNKKINYLTIEDEIINQLLLIVSIIMKNKQTTCEIELKKQIIIESLKLLKKINPSKFSKM